MNVIHQPLQLAAGDRRVCVALGMFDGVHLGHQRVLSQTVSQARKHHGLAVAVTFDRHPNSVVAPERTPPLIYSLPQRLRAMAAVGIDTAWLIPFDRPFSEQPAEKFVAGLTQGFSTLQSISIGRDFTFGHKRAGNVGMLRTLGEQLRFQVHALLPVQWQGQTISSTRIRKAIKEGELRQVDEMLDRPYAMAGQVVRGKQLGQQLGFATANVNIAGLVTPPRGVYAGEVHVGGQPLKAVANLGYRPTLGSPHPELALEVHILDFRGDLYGEELEFAIVKFLRPEQKFTSLDVLREQIQKDVAAVRRLFH